MCVVGSIFFWVLCYGINFGRHTTLLLPEFQSMSPALAWTLELSYWALPKPLDFHLILLQSQGAENLFAQLVDTRQLVERNAWAPVGSVLASLGCGLALLGVSAYDFLTMDY